MLCEVTGGSTTMVAGLGGAGVGVETDPGEELLLRDGVTDKKQSLLLLEGGAPLLTVESVVDAKRMKAELLLENPSLLLERVKMK
ncbi:hypothetical protein NC653_041550 [Populus alba x Populus x berolinensis]|uniref:Uncharacterized protein n=1 Tax=Populus alba x Populus x berolinensis TaxID=444605 RepID=A0AAD6L8W0_9ROSI|nr:hypothetical protein NC653_041550 [Populus alba x Populus x berolinensis]